MLNHIFFFQECISKSAIQTKFESHAVSGLKIANMVKVIMEQIVGCAFQQRLVSSSIQWNTGSFTHEKVPHTEFSKSISFVEMIQTQLRYRFTSSTA